ncbi:hypothetical protein FRC07_000286 [Ceratobasidium sp. 392]|nr:hypothetical protein FRC07_000286 [Ceratobasidium sp. 392]
MAPPGDRYKVKAKRHHAYTGFIFLIGFLLPPFAVAARFGLGTDFWINVLLTICGWVPGQIHNFYIQTVRNNKNVKRTPQWAVRHGLVDDSTIKRHKKRSEWSHRYNDRLPQSALDDAEFAPDQVPDAPANADVHSPNQTITSRRASTIGGARSPAALWREDDSEGFYDRTKVEPPRGNKPRKNSGWRFDGGFPDEDATTGIGGSIYTEPERRPRKKRSTKHTRSSSIDSPLHGSRVGSRVWEDPLGAEDIVPRANGNGHAASKAGGDGLDHEF